MMTKLHELLAVENGLAEAANAATRKVNTVLVKRPAALTGLTREHIIFDEDSQHLKMATEVKEVETTVPFLLGQMSKDLATYWDVSLQKEAANQKAVADIVIDDITLATNVPAIILLSMEKKLQALIPVYQSIPVLDPAVAWEADPAYAIKKVFRTKYTTERQQNVTNKVWKEVSKATAAHPAQVVQDEEITLIGKYVLTNFSGALPSSEKTAMLDRLNKLIRGVKTARQRANSVEVDTSLNFGKALLDYVNA